MGAKRAFTVFAILTALPILAGCGEDARARDPGSGSQADGGSPAAERSTTARSGGDTPSRQEREAGKPPGDAVARAGEAKARAGEKVRAGGDAGARAGNAVAGADPAIRPKNPISGMEFGDGARATGDRGGPPREVVVAVEGDDATRFAGTCSVGGEEREIGGRVPQLYTFRPGGETLECEIRESGPGTVNVVLTAGNTVRSVQQSGAGESKVGLTYSEGGVSVTQSSSGSVNRIGANSSRVSSRTTDSR